MLDGALIHPVEVLGFECTAFGRQLQRNVAKLVVLAERYANRTLSVAAAQRNRLLLENGVVLPGKRKVLFCKNMPIRLVLMVLRCQKH